MGAAAGVAEGEGPEAQEELAEEAEEAEEDQEEADEEAAEEEEEEKEEEEAEEGEAEVDRQGPEAEEAPSTPRREPLEEAKALAPAITLAAGSASPEAPLSQEEAVHAKLHNGEMLPHALRIQVWAERLRHSPGGSTASSAPASSPVAGGAVAAVRHLLVASGSSQGGSGSLAAEDSYAAALAAAFVERHLHWLSEADANFAGGAEGGPAFAMLAQVLRYHYPTIAGSADLASALTAACDGPTGLFRLLLSPVSEGDEMTLLLLCDLLVLEDMESLALFVIMALAMEAHQEGTNFEKVRLQGFGARGSAGVRRCVARACEFHEATPRSLVFALARGSGTSARPRLRLPICVVAPDEVIHHVYERPSGSWRFVVVDVRREADSDLALPVGLRLNPTQDRRAVLKGLAYEESIHLCFVGDGPPASGDEALELCRFLAGSTGGRRPHVSVAEGGWPAVSGLVQSFGLEFMRVGAPKKDARAGPSSPKAPKGLQQAVASLAGVAEQVTSGATAAAVRHQVAKQAKQVRSQAGRALFGFGGSRSTAAPTEPQRA